MPARAAGPALSGGASARTNARSACRAPPACGPTQILAPRVPELGRQTGRKLRDDARARARLARRPPARGAGCRAGAARVERDHRERGWVGLTVRRAGRSRSPSPRTGAAWRASTGAAAGCRTRRPGAATGGCAEFVATAADGRTATAEARTPSCRDRLDVGAPRPRAAGPHRRASRVRDRWGLGDVARRGLRAARPAAGRLPRRAARHGRCACRSACRGRASGAARRGAVGRASSRSVDVARRGGRQRLLVTGDSMIQPLDDFLEQRLRPHGVRRDERPEHQHRHLQAVAARLARARARARRRACGPTSPSCCSAPTTASRSATAPCCGGRLGRRVRRARAAG